MKRWISLLLLLVFLCSCSSSEEISTPQQELAGATPTQGGPDLAPTVTPTLEALPSETVPPPSLTPTDIPPTLTPTLQPFPTPQALTTGEIITITQIQMVDPGVGWGVGYQQDSGDHILQTQDGGQTWEDRTPPDTTANQPGKRGAAWSHFLNPQAAWVIYAPRDIPPASLEPFIWRTQDAGLTWEAAPLKTEGMEEIFIPGGFASVGEDYGWLLVHVGAGMSHDYSFLYHTQDGGASWDRIVDPYGVGIQSLRNTGIAFADSEYGWVTKDNLGVMPGAFLEESRDGGQTWEDVFLPEPPELNWMSDPSLCQTSSPTFPTEDVGFLIVKCRLPEDIQRGVDWSLTYVYRTADRGGTWQHTLLPSPVEELIFLNPEYGWAFGRDYFFTKDGGITWELLKTVNWDGEFTFPDPTYGWAVARNEGEIALVATEDGGQTWRIIEAQVR